MSDEGGRFATPLDVLQIRVAGQFEAVEQLRAMPIRGTSGNQMRLGDIAEEMLEQLSIHDNRVGRPAKEPRRRAGTEGSNPRQSRGI